MQLDEIRLRALEPEDAPAVAAMENDITALDSTWLMAPLSVELVRTYALTYDADPLRAGEIRFVVECGGDVAGLVDLTAIDARNLRAEVGLIVRPDLRSKGIGKRVLDLIADYARGWLHLQRLTAIVSADNDASCRLFARAGYKVLSILPQWLRRPDGSFADAHLLLRTL